MKTYFKNIIKPKYTILILILCTIMKKCINMFALKFNFDPYYAVTTEIALFIILPPLCICVTKYQIIKNAELLR